MRSAKSTSTPRVWFRCIVLALACSFLLVEAQMPQPYTFPAKSINLEGAAKPEFYKLVPPERFPSGFDDPHPVHGIETSAGDFVLVGKGIRDGISETDSFAVKMNSTGDVQWFWTSKLNGDDAANAVGEISSDEVIVVGWSTPAGGIGKRSIWKLNLATGQEVWQASFDSPNAAQTSAYENLEIASNDKSAYFTGFVNKASLDEMFFKSYGNVVEGTAIVERMSLEKLQGAQKPSASDFSWTRTWPEYLTAKACRVVEDSFNSQLGCLLYAESEAKMAAVIVLKTPDGTAASPVWSEPKDYGLEHGEATDLEISVNKGAVILSGHGGTSSPKSLSGRLSRIDINDGSKTWTKSFSVGGNEQVIYNECWGVARIGDSDKETSGYVMSCGAGIENCAGMSGSMLSDCQAGRKVVESDPRTGAYPRPAAVWQSYMARINKDGTLKYQRVDQYREPGAPALGESGWESFMTSSASEWVIATKDGGMALVQDEQAGIALFKLSPEETTSTPPATPSPSSPTTPPAAPEPDMDADGKSIEKEHKHKHGDSDSKYVPGLIIGSIAVTALCVFTFWKKRTMRRRVKRQEVELKAQAEAQAEAKPASV